MELIQGCRDRNSQQIVERELQRFTVHWPTFADCNRAHQDFADYHLSHSLGLLDSLIAHTATGLGETLATFNVKHYAVVNTLATIQPY